MVGQTQVVVGAKADHLPAVGFQLGLLGRGDDPLGFEQASFFEQFDLMVEVGQVAGIHGDLLS